MRATRVCLRLLLDVPNLSDDELVLVAAVRLLVMLDASGLGVPVREKDAVLRAIARYMSDHAVRDPAGREG